MLVVNYGQKFNFSKQFLHCRVRTKKLLDTKVEKMLKEFWNYFLGVKNCFFSGLAVLVL
jgi:hypothetical protein